MNQSKYRTLEPKQRRDTDDDNNNVEQKSWFYSDGNIECIQWIKGDKFHRGVTPASNEGGSEKIGPAVIYYYRNGIILSKEWYNEGLLHRKDGPAYIEYYSNGLKEVEIWYKNDKMCRNDGPVKIRYHENGNVKVKEWIKNGNLHRKDGPAFIVYNDSGNVLHEEWRRNGEYYRKNGKVAIGYYDDGITVKNIYYIIKRSHGQIKYYYYEYDKPGKLTYKNEW